MGMGIHHTDPNPHQGAIYGRFKNEGQRCYDKQCDEQVAHGRFLSTLDTGWSFLILVNDLVKSFETLAYITAAIINQWSNTFIARAHDNRSQAVSELKIEN
jgi:hypothetical protein